MGEGFVVAASNDVDIYYYMDEAGSVLADMPEWAPVPEWGVDIKCGKGTNFRWVLTKLTYFDHILATSIYKCT